MRNGGQHCESNESTGRSGIREVTQPAEQFHNLNAWKKYSKLHESGKLNLWYSFFFLLSLLLRRDVKIDVARFQSATSGM